MNKKKIIEDLSQKAYDEQFLKNLDENKNVFACNNGVLDLEQCIFRNGEPSDMITISSNIDFPNDVDSLEANEILISIQDWLDKIFPDYDLQEYVLNIISQKLSGKLFWEKFHILTGSGANGKSQLCKLINKSFGDYYHTFDNTILNTTKVQGDGATPAIAALKGKRIAVTSEPKSGKPFESDKIKELTGGDELSARNLFQGLFKFFPQYAMFLQCNDIPENDSTDDGFWRRMYVIPCVAKFITKEEDMYKLNDPVKYPNHFRAENQEHLYASWAPYFLYMLFKRFVKLKNCDFIYPVPDLVLKAIDDYKKMAGVYTRFFNEKIIEAPGYKIDNNTLYTEFKSFVDSDFKPKKMTFTTQMEKLLGKAKGYNKEYFGFKLRGTSGESIDDGENDNEDD
jgi:P4 family phage/plasmid primase-like protien